MDDWIEWPGGLTPPVDKNTVVDVRFRNGDVADEVSPGVSRWEIRGEDTDIIAYRIHRKNDMPHPHAENMRLYAEDAAETDRPWWRWEKRDDGGPWEDCAIHPGWSRNCEYRRKPRTININGLEVPKPISRAPEHGTDVFCSDTSSVGLVLPFTWVNSADDFVRLANRVVHLDYNSAEKHALALLSFTQYWD